MLRNAKSWLDLILQCVGSFCSWIFSSMCNLLGLFAVGSYFAMCWVVLCNLLGLCIWISLLSNMYIHTCIHTFILDLGSFVLDLICILSLDLRVFCCCSHFGYQAKQQWHPVNGLLAAIFRLHHGPRQQTNRSRCRTVQHKIGG